jgi:hypothetical protein
MRLRWIGSGLAALAAVAFLPTLWSLFAADDFLLRYAAMHSSLGDVLTSDPLKFQGGGNFFRPVWFAYDWVLVSISQNPALFHALNLILYGAVVAEVWLLLRRIVRPNAAIVAAGLFAVYPRHTEVVAWYAGSIDLLSTLFGLGAILLLLQPSPTIGRLADAAVLAALAAASKENAYLLAPLFVLVQVARRQPLWGQRRAWAEVWQPSAALVAGGLAAGIWRLASFHKVGGYASHPWTIPRALAAGGSDILAAASVPQVPLLVHMAWLALPVGVWLLALWAGTRVAVRFPDRRQPMLAGLAFSVVALLPTLNVPVNLDTSTDERFLFLPSVGLAIALAAALPPLPSRRGLQIAAVIAAVLLDFSLQSSLNWQQASTLASKLVDQTTQLAHGRGEVLLLSAPERYKNGALLTPGLDAAVALRGGQARLTWCSAIDVRAIASGQVRFTRAPNASFIGETLAGARVHFPFSGAVSPPPLTPDCTFAPGPSPPHLGSATSVRVIPSPAVRPVRVVFFDGNNIVAAPH